MNCEFLESRPKPTSSLGLWYKLPAVDNHDFGSRSAVVVNPHILNLAHHVLTSDNLTKHYVYAERQFHLK